jgi:site-specific recombinase XerD
VKEHALGRELRAALASAKLPIITWYQSTRHTYVSHWVQAGGSLAKLAEILGHSTSEVTLRYAHLAPGNFTEHERRLAHVQLHDAPVLPLPLKRQA